MTSVWGMEVSLKKALVTAINEYANSGKDEDKEVADALLELILKRIKYND